MINENMYQLGAEPSAIRELFAYGLERKAQIGADKVFDFSLGNPSIPAPDEVRKAIAELLDEPPSSLHGYTPAQGLPSTRKALADSFTQRFGYDADPNLFYLTAGAAASLDITITALANPGDEFIVIAPYFPEYKLWIEHAECTCVEVPARESDFQIDCDALAAALTPRTKGIIINSPNNPVGVVYPLEIMQALAAVLEAKQKEFSTDIYLICDEPYREIAYDGIEVPFVPSVYANTVVCYSYSKSLSLPGERIGYIYVADTMPQAKRVYTAICGAGRALGFVCAPSLFQRVIEACIDVPTNIEAYASNRKLLTEGLSAMGYEFIEPEGAFYLWMKALEADEQAFADRAREHELLIVPSTSFGTQGWVRIGYCVDEGTITRSMPAFQALMDEYAGESR